MTMIRIKEEEVNILVFVFSPISLSISCLISSGGAGTCSATV